MYMDSPQSLRGLPMSADVDRHDPMRLPWRPLMLPLNALRQADRKARTHSKQQIRRIADSILHLGFINPIVVDRRRKIVAG
ncbi:MAG: ParB N-terminal domain-containing protein, partial [Rhodoplanes sp.]